MKEHADHMPEAQISKELGKTKFLNLNLAKYANFDAILLQFNTENTETV